MKFLKITKTRKTEIYGCSAIIAWMTGNRVFNSINPYVGIALWFVALYMIFLICKNFKRQDNDQKN